MLLATRSRTVDPSRLRAHSRGPRPPSPGRWSPASPCSAGWQSAATPAEIAGLYFLALTVNVAALLFAAGIALRLRTLQAGPLMQIPIFILLFLAPVYVPQALLTGWVSHAAAINPITLILNATREPARRRAGGDRRHLRGGARADGAARRLGGDRDAARRGRRLRTPPARDAPPTIKPQCSRTGSRSSPRKRSPRRSSSPRSSATLRSPLAHLLVALLEQDDGLVVPILQKLGADLAAVGARAGEPVERAADSWAATRQPSRGPPRPWSRPCAAPRAEMAKLGDEYISTEHLLLALTDKGSGVADAPARPRLAGEGGGRGARPAQGHLPQPRGQRPGAGEIRPRPDRGGGARASSTR